MRFKEIVRALPVAILGCIVFYGVLLAALLVLNFLEGWIV